jgi:hypothetical protein
MFIRATDVQWAKLVELGVTSMRKLIDYLAATDASARCNGAPAGVPVVLKRSLFNWCRDSGRQVHLEIEAAVACGYLIQGGVAPYEWLHCCPPGGVQAPPAAQIAATAAGRDRSMYKSRLCRNWLQWGTTPPHTHTHPPTPTHTHTPTHPSHTRSYRTPSLALLARRTPSPLDSAGSCRYAECCQFAHGAPPRPAHAREEREEGVGVGWRGAPRIGCGGQLPPSPSAPLGDRPWPRTPRPSGPSPPAPPAPSPLAPVDPLQASQSSVGLPPCTSTGGFLTRCCLRSMASPPRWAPPASTATPTPCCCRRAASPHPSTTAPLRHRLLRTVVGSPLPPASSRAPSRRACPRGHDRRRRRGPRRGCASTSSAAGARALPPLPPPPLRRSGRPSLPHPSPSPPHPSPPHHRSSARACAAARMARAAPSPTV